MSKGIRVKILSWNMGKNQKDLDSWIDEIRKSWSPITLKDYDALFVSIQEDHRGKYGRIGEAIGFILKDEFTMVSNSVEGPVEITGLSFSVRAIMYLRKSLFVNYGVRKNDVCLKRTVYCSKSTSGVAIIVNINNSLHQFIFMASHLPMDGRVEDLGYQQRIDAIKKSMEEVYDKIEDRTIEKRAAFWAGDLNFRDSIPTRPGGNPILDQLKYAMSTRPSAFFREFVESDDPNFNPTCKRASCKDGVCPRCRNVSTNGRFDPECYAQNDPENKTKFRFPSHCDRILYRIDEVDATINEYRSWAGAASIQNSDHDMVLASFTIMI